MSNIKELKFKEITPTKAEMLSLGWEERLKLHVKEFNKNHAVVIVGGKTRIMRRTVAAADSDNRDGFEFIIPAELNAVYANTAIQIGIKRDKYGEEAGPLLATEFNAWYKHQDSDVYRSGVIFRPGIDAPEGYFNTWQGFSVKPKKSCEYPKIKSHIEGIICQHNQELIKYFYSWIAYTLQNPGKVVGSALVLRGNKGSGKGIIGHFLRRIWGRHALYISQASQITGNFNGHLADVCFLFADEAFFSGDKKHEGTLKALVTENKLMIERKGVDPEQQANYLKLFMVTNSEYAVPASADERRWAVFDVSDSMTNNDKYFKALLKEVNDKDVMSSFLADMLEYDVTAWQPSKIPESFGLREQRAHSLNSPGRWLLDCLHSGTIDGDDWLSIVGFKVLKDCYLKWCNDHKENGYEIVTDTALGKYLSKIYEKRRDSEGIKYVVLPLSDSIKRFEEIEKIDII